MRKKALSNLDFFVVQDIFETETTRLAGRGAAKLTVLLKKTGRSPIPNGGFSG